MTLTEENRFSIANKIVDLFLGNTVLYCIIIVMAVAIWYLATKSKVEIQRLAVENDRLVDENRKMKEILSAEQTKNKKEGG